MRNCQEFFRNLRSKIAAEFLYPLASFLELIKDPTQVHFHDVFERLVEAFWEPYLNICWTSLAWISGPFWTSKRPQHETRWPPKLANEPRVRNKIILESELFIISQCFRNTALSQKAPEEPRRLPRIWGSYDSWGAWTKMKRINFLVSAWISFEGILRTILGQEQRLFGGPKIIIIVFGPKEL